MIVPILALFSLSLFFAADGQHVVFQRDLNVLWIDAGKFGSYLKFGCSYDPPMNSSRCGFTGSDADGDLVIHLGDARRRPGGTFRLLAFGPGADGPAKRYSSTIAGGTA